MIFYFQKFLFFKFKRLPTSVFLGGRKASDFLGGKIDLVEGVTIIFYLLDFSETEKSSALFLLLLLLFILLIIVFVLVLGFC